MSDNQWKKIASGGVAGAYVVTSKVVVEGTAIYRTDVEEGTHALGGSEREARLALADRLAALVAHLRG